MRFPLIALIALTACTAQQQAKTQTVMSNAIASGQLICQTTTALGPSLVAVVNAADGSPVIVTGRAAAWVAAICAAINAVPVPPPVVPVALPVKAAKVG